MKSLNNAEKVVITIILLFATSLGVYSNTHEKITEDKSKLPSYVEDSPLFQKWITNHKNKNINLEGDAFRLVEENEVYNSKRLKIYDASAPLIWQKYKDRLEIDVKKGVRFSESKIQLVDFRYETRYGLDGEEIRPNELWYLGLRNGRIISNKLLACSEVKNCIHDRAFFISEDIIVASEFSRNVEAGEGIVPPACGMAELCEYTVKLYVMDIASNSNLVYQSPPIKLILANKINGF